MKNYAKISHIVVIIQKIPENSSSIDIAILKNIGNIQIHTPTHTHTHIDRHPIAIEEG